MTLIEVVLSMGLFAVIALASLYTTLSVKTTNEIMATAIVANNSLREQTEEVQFRAVEHAYDSRCGSLSKGLVYYYGTQLGEKAKAVDSVAKIMDYADADLPVSFYNKDDKTLLVRFPVHSLPDPRDTGSRREGVGLMTIYLDPSSMPEHMRKADEIVYWKHLGDSEGDKTNVVESDSVAIKSWNFSNPSTMGFADVFVEIGVGYPLHRSISRVDVARADDKSVAADARWMTRRIMIPDNTASLSFKSTTSSLNGGM